MAKTEAATATDQQSDRIAAVLERLADQAPVPEIGYGHPKYQERLREEGFFVDFASPVYQNGKQAQARGLKPETIERAPKLRPGKFCNGRVEVLRDSRDRVHLLYKHANTEDRMRMQAWCRDFDHLVDMIYTEQQAA